MINIYTVRLEDCHWHNKVEIGIKMYNNKRTQLIMHIHTWKTNSLLKAESMTHSQTLIAITQISP